MRDFDILLEQALLEAVPTETQIIDEIVQAQRETDPHKAEKRWDNAEDMAEQLLAAGGNDLRVKVRRARRKAGATSKPSGKEKEKRKGGILTGVLDTFLQHGYRGA